MKEKIAQQMKVEADQRRVEELKTRNLELKQNLESPTKLILKPNETQSEETIVYPGKNREVEEVISQISRGQAVSQLPKAAESKQELLKYLLSVTLTKQPIQGKTLLESLKSDNKLRD